MATKKQQRRRQKQQRHEWEEVYVDETGRELDPEEAEDLVGTAETKRGAARASSRSRLAGQRGARAIQPPSWQRVAKRGALFFPLMLVTVMLLGEELTLAQQVVQTCVLMAFFLPFSYFMDSMMWRSHQRRIARQSGKD